MQRKTSPLQQKTQRTPAKNHEEKLVESSKMEEATTMSFLSWIYHGKDTKQCYNEANCLFCSLRFAVRLVQLRREVES